MKAEREGVTPDPVHRPARAQWPAALRSLRHREFRLFWPGLIISVTGTWMQMAAQSWLVYDLTESALWLGLVGASGTVPMLLFSLPAGVVADRLSKRNILLATQGLAMLQALVLGALTFWGIVQVWHVMALAAFLGTVNALDMPTRHAMVVELVGRDDLLNAVSLNSSAFNAGRIVGPAAAGLLIGAAGTAGCFLINGLTFLPLIFMLMLIAPRPPSQRVKAAMVAQMKDGIVWARSQTVAKSVLALIAVVSVFGMSYGTLLPVFARDVFHKGAQAYGFLMSTYAVGALTSAMMLTALGHRWRLGALMTTGSLLFPVALLAVALSPGYRLALGALFVTGVGMMLFNAVANTILQKASPDELRGRVMSMRTLLFSGMMPVGSMQMGSLGEWLGPRAAVGIGAVVCLGAGLSAWWRVPELRQSS